MKNKTEQTRIFGMTVLQLVTILVIFVICCCIVGFAAVYIFGKNLGNSLVIPTPSLSAVVLPTQVVSAPSQLQTMPAPLSPPEGGTPDESISGPTFEVIMPAGWQTYTSSECGFSIGYPPGSTLYTGTGNPDRIDFPVTPGTNLIEKYLEMGCYTDKSYCELSVPEVATTSTTINGYDFRVQTGGEGAAGSVYMSTRYILDGEPSCISLTFVLHYGQLANYDPPVQAYDEAAESLVIDQVMSTFMLTTP